MVSRLSNEKSLESLRDNTWELNLCNCFDHPLTWCYSCWCPCLAYKDILKQRNLQSVDLALAQHGHLAERENSESHGIQEEMALGTEPPHSGLCGPWAKCFWWSCLEWFTCCGPVLSASDRTNIRRDYGIAGSYLSDLLLHCCCLPCAFTQEKFQVTDANAQHKRVNRVNKYRSRSFDELKALNGTVEDDTYGVELDKFQVKKDDKPAPPKYEDA